MHKLEDYNSRYKCVDMTRDDGVLTLRLHTDGGPMIWGGVPHEELGYCFADVAADRDNEVVIITGTADAFIGSMDFPPVDRMPPAIYEHLIVDAQRLINNLLAIEVPVIGAVNGPARVHAELALLSDIVIASDTAVFQDAPHFPAGLVPGDGVHVLWPALLGPNRGKYFLLTGQELDAQDALRLGVVSEVLAPGKLMERAHELAGLLRKQPSLTRRRTRSLLTRRWQTLMHQELTQGLMMEGLAWADAGPNGLRIR